MEKQIFLAIHDFRHPLLDILSLIVSGITEYAILWIIIALGLIIFRKQIGLQIATRMGLAFIIELFITNLIFKLLIERPRPLVAIPGIEVLGKTWISNSFPSGHVGSTVAVLWVLISFFPRYRFWAIVFTPLLMWSRIYAGMHWPSDVVGGVVVGVVSGWLALKILRSLHEN